MNKRSAAVIGAATGFLNGFFGSGGGIAAVPLLKKYGEEPKKAHAESLAVTLPLSAVSAAVYFINGGGFEDKLLWAVPAGLAGALAGSLFMKRVSPVWLGRIFAVILIAAGIRILTA